MCRQFFDGVTVQQMLREWRAHTALFPYVGYDELDMREYLDIWSSSVSHTMQTAISAVCEEILYHYLPERQYGLYTDWIATVGVVPIQESPSTMARSRERFLTLRNAISEHGTSSPLVAQALDSMVPAFERIVTGLTSAEIPNCGDVTITRRRDNGHIRAFRGTREIHTYVYLDPLAYEDGNLVYATPVAHLYREIARYDSLCRHQKVCQLLNTRPVKIVTMSRHESNTKKIVEMMEKHDKTTDAKKALMKFLLNMSESKSRIGIEDSIESFIQEITPPVVDHSKLLPTRGPNAAGPSVSPYDQAASSERDVRDLFKKQIIKCMEEQLEAQTDEIQDLKMLNQAWERKAEELRSTLSRYGHDLSNSGGDREDLDRLPVMDAIRRVQSMPTDSVSVDDNITVANSFLSQFIPNCDTPGKNLDVFWETEYIRSFKLKKIFTNQGTEENISYSNYTVERVLTPFLTRVLNISGLGPIPEDCLYLSLPELVEMAYKGSKLNQYVRFVCNRELARQRWEQQRAEEALAVQGVHLTASARSQAFRNPASSPYPETRHYISDVRKETTQSHPDWSYGKLHRLKNEQNVQRPADPWRYGDSP